MISELLGIIDIVLIMTVNPGFGGQKLITSCLEKVRKLATLRKSNGYEYLIAVDGGINRDTVRGVVNAGTDVLITGSAFFESANPAEEVRLFKGRGVA